MRICVTRLYGTDSVIRSTARLRLMVNPTLKNVARRPDATPRRSGGTLPIIELMFGEAKIPSPAPKMTRCSTTTGYGVEMSRVDRRKRERLTSPSPPVVNGRWPYRSESLPLRGPRMIVVMSSGMNRSPTFSGLRSRTSWR